MVKHNIQNNVENISYTELNHYQREWKDAPRRPVGERVERAEGQSNVPLTGRDGVADVDGADRLYLEDKNNAVGVNRLLVE